MRLLPTLATVLLLAALAIAPARADDVSEELKVRSNALALRAEKVLQKEGPAAAIRALEEGLLDLDDDYGRVHLRLGELYQQLKRPAEAAFHFRACDADERVDATDREVFCRAGFEAVTAPLTIEGLAPAGRVLVLEPEGFAGEVRSGVRLPLGHLRLLVEAPGREPAATDLELAGPLAWQAVVGELYGAAARVPPVPGAPRQEPDDAAPASDVGVWPAFATAGVGAALVGTGLFLGFDNRDTLDGIRDRQSSGDCGAGRCLDALDDARGRAQLSDGLWIGGTVVIAGAAALFWVLSGDAR